MGIAVVLDCIHSYSSRIDRVKIGLEQFVCGPARIAVSLFHDSHSMHTGEFPPN